MDNGKRYIQVWLNSNMLDEPVFIAEDQVASIGEHQSPSQTGYRFKLVDGTMVWTPTLNRYTFGQMISAFEHRRRTREPAEYPIT